MPVWLTWLIGVALVLLEGVVLVTFGVEDHALQLGLAMTVYLGLARPLVPGALVLVALMWPIEWMAAAPAGYYALGLAVVFLLLRLVRGLLQTGWGVARLVAAIAAGLVHGLVMAAAFLIHQPDSPLIGAILWPLVPAALLAGSSAWLLGRLLGRLDESMAPRRSRLLDA